MLSNPTRPKSEPREPSLRGLSYWQPDPDAAPFFGLARDVQPERFKPRRLGWFGRLWLRVRLWWWS